MDPLSAAALTAVLVKMFDSTAEEAGRDLWQSLRSLTGRVFRRDQTTRAIERVDSAVTAGSGPDLAQLDHLAASLATEAQHSTVAAQALREWAGHATSKLDHDGAVHNIVHGEVRGNVIQAKDIHGDITFN